MNNFIQMWKELFVLGQRKVNVLRRRSNDQVLIGMTMVRAEVVVLGKVNLSKLLLNLEQGKSSIFTKDSKTLQARIASNHNHFSS